MVHHSPMARTTQTAEVIARYLGADLVVDERLREIEFGQWDGLSMTALESDSSTELARWRSSAEAKPPGGESVVDLAKRVEQAATELIAGNPGQNSGRGYPHDAFSWLRQYWHRGRQWTVIGTLISPLPASAFTGSTEPASPRPSRSILANT